MAKRVLIHSLIFSPDGVSTAYLYSDIAIKLQEAGYEVIVLTTTPHYNVVPQHLKKQPLKWSIWGLFKTSDFHGMRVIHIPQKKSKNTVLRLVWFLYWHILSFFIGLNIRGVDVILSPSPPLTIGVINIWLAKLKGCKVIYNVQEIYPDILSLKNGCLLSLLKKVERYVYRHSSAVTTIDQVFYDVIVDRIAMPEKLHIIPNFVDTKLYNPSNGDISLLDRTDFPMTDSLKILYAGNIGFAQDWETLISLALKTKSELIEYFVIGEGVMKPWLVQRRDELGLDKIHILPYQPRSLMPSVLSYSDIQFIFMSPEMEMQGFPSKVYTIMACAKPLIVCSGAQTPIVQFLERYDCALLVPEREPDEKAGHICRWLSSQSREDLQAMGVNGLTAIHSNYSSDVVTQKYVQLLASL